MSSDPTSDSAIVISLEEQRELERKLAELEEERNLLLPQRFPKHSSPFNRRRKRLTAISKAKYDIKRNLDPVRRGERNSYNRERQRRIYRRKEEEDTISTTGEDNMRGSEANDEEDFLSTVSIQLESAVFVCPNVDVGIQPAASKFDLSCEILLPH